MIWFFLDSRICETGDNLSHLTTILPSKNNRKSVRVSLKGLREQFSYTHIIIVVPKSLIEVRIHVDIYSVAERHLVVQAPRWVTYFMKKQVMFAWSSWILPTVLNLKISLMAHLEDKTSFQSLFQIGYGTTDIARGCLLRNVNCWIWPDVAGFYFDCDPCGNLTS